jgi:tetratricopeptide (TPR) repeat protein
LRQACQFSAFVLLFHALLDKPLVMPPTSILAMLFVGLLLRWRLPVRLVAPPAGGPRMLQRVLAGLAVGAAGYLTVTVVWRDALFRRGAIAERAGFPQTAYRAYADSAKVAPWDVRTNAYAGICAIKQLGEPALAWEHLYRAWQMEPNFAHINGDMGRCLGKVGEHARALPFLKRETELFPFDPSAWRNLFVCGVITGRIDDLGLVQDRLNWLRLRHVCRQLGAGNRELGRQKAKKMAAAFALAAEGGEPGQGTEALVIAGQLSTGLSLPGCEAKRTVGNPRLYSMLDVAFWHVRFKWRNAWLHCDKEDPAALLAAWNGLSSDYRQVGFAEFAESAGWQTLVARTSPQAVELRRAKASFLVVPKTGRIRPKSGIEDLVRSAEVRQELGVKVDEESLAVSVRVGQLRQYERVQYLAYALHALLPDTMPSLYRSPVAQFYAARHRFQRANLKVALRVDAVDE